MRFTRVAFIVGLFIILFLMLGQIFGALLIPYDNLLVGERPHNTMRIINDYFEVGVGNKIVFVIVILVSGLVVYLAQRIIFKTKVNVTKQKTA